MTYSVVTIDHNEREKLCKKAQSEGYHKLKKERATIVLPFSENSRAAPAEHLWDTYL